MRDIAGGDRCDVAWIASTSAAIRSVAVAVALCSASSLTSFATTAKPVPASPARAASIVAFSASSFVCAATRRITSIKLTARTPISSTPITRPARVRMATRFADTIVSTSWT